MLSKKGDKFTNRFIFQRLYPAVYYATADLLMQRTRRRLADFFSRVKMKKETLILFFQVEIIFVSFYFATDSFVIAQFPC